MVSLGIKSKILGILNLLISALSLYLIYVTFVPLIPLSLNSLLHNYLPQVVFVFAFATSAYMTYELLFNKSHPRLEKNASLYLYSLVTLNTISWFFLLFIGYFFASNPLYFLISIILIAIIFFLVKKYSQKIGIIIAALTVTVLLTSIAFGFEEDYCIKKGELADPTGTKSRVATIEDQKTNKDFIPGQTLVGINWQTHMLCHNNFNFLSAFKESYLFQKSP